MRPSAFSQPLMGIWNLDIPLDGKVYAVTSQPLMGIWNRPRSIGWWRMRSLTTPHGDLEPATRRSWSRRMMSSQPLMGIWNRRRRSRCRRRHPLTTPHGDLEPSGGPLAHVCSQPHNPSWGFGTKARMPCTSSAMISQPLMGIWNAGTPRVWPSRRTSHNPSWGFGTLGDRLMLVRQEVLTTPHGDLEPATVAVSSCLGRTSQPLMGIWNVRTCPRERAFCWLTTPHGDLEPSLQQRSGCPALG